VIDALVLAALGFLLFQIGWNLAKIAPVLLG